MSMHYPKIHDILEGYGARRLYLGSHNDCTVFPTPPEDNYTFERGHMLGSCFKLPT